NPTARAGPNVSDRKEPTLLGGAGCRIDRAMTIASRAELATAARSETSRATTRGATVRSRADKDKPVAEATADSPRWIVRSHARSQAKVDAPPTPRAPRTNSIRAKHATRAASAASPAAGIA